ncbi:MAG TPA: PAS domain S-box protein [Kofleriaceae bacterium]|nr:PAS domain S-box protein [Kofleriaceae bacterium]
MGQLAQLTASGRELGREPATFMLDRSGVITSWSTGAQHATGYVAKDVIGRHVELLVVPEAIDKERLAKLLERAIAEGSASAEIWCVHANHSRFRSEMTAARVVDTSGNHAGYSVHVRDLARPEDREALRQSEERLRMMIQAVKDYAIFMLDPDGRVASWNAGAERLKGYRADEIVGYSFERFYPHEDVERGKAAHELRVATATGRFEEEGWRVRKDGTRFWANVVLSAVRDSHDRLVGFTKVTRDITERKRMEEELARRARQQALVGELGLFALQSRDLQPLLERVVAAVHAMLGVDLVVIFARTEAGMVPRASFGGPIAPDVDPDSIPDMATRLVVTIHSRDAEHPFGALAIYARTERALETDEVHFARAISNVIATFLARREAEVRGARAERDAELAKATTALAKKQLRERDEFISVAAHELRTPLMALQLKLEGFDQMLRKPEVKPDAISGRLEGALRQASRLGELIERLLDVSRASREELQLVFEDFDLGVLVTETVEDYRDTARRANVELSADVEGDLRGRWDRGRISQVLVNVLANAIKYGAGRPVCVHARGDGDRVSLTIEDHGIGIDAADLDRIFGRFERAAPLRNYGGLGLGLYISRFIVEALGGTIRVSSQAGQGSVFHIELPRISEK